MTRAEGTPSRRSQLGGGQVAWLEQGGGNDLELILKVARLSGGKPKEIEFVTNGNRAGGDPRGQWLGQLLGGGPLSRTTAGRSPAMSLMALDATGTTHR